MKKTVCIIGAGVAGLATTKVFLEDSDSYEVTVYEKGHDIGGLWHPSRVYPGLRSNSMKYTYGFSELPVPDNYPEYPTAAQMFQYFDAYAKKFKLREHIEFGVEVIRTHLIQEGAEEQWEVTIMRQGEPDPEVISFDILIIATGLFTTPVVPHFTNQENFTGILQHSSKITNYSIFKEKRVLVVGVGKSGVDMANLAAQHAATCTLAFRQAHWALPCYAMKGKLSLRYLLMSKFSGTLFPYYYKMPFLSYLYSLFMGPFVRRIERLILYASKKDTGLPRSHHMFPTNLHVWNDPSISTVPNEFYDAVRKGKINPVLGTVEFAGNGKGVRFSDGSTSEFDLVILCTGYSVDFPFLDPETTNKIQLENPDPEFPVLSLYRFLVPLGSKSIGFVGFVNCFRNPLAYELGAHWLTEYFNNRIKPKQNDMKKDIKRRLDFAKKLFNKDPKGGFSVLCLDNFYRMQLLSDMKLPLIRTSNFFKENFLPQYPIWYESISRQKMAARNNIKLPPQKYFSFCQFTGVVLLVSLTVAAVIMLYLFVRNHFLNLH